MARLPTRLDHKESDSSVLLSDSETMPDSPDLTASLPLGRDSLSIPLSHANGELVASMTAARHVAFDTEQSGCEEVSRDVGSSQGVSTDDCK